MNGLVKVPMQFFILLLGALLFTFYQFNPSPVFFNKAAEDKALLTPYKDSLLKIKNQFEEQEATQQAHSKLFVLQPTAAIKDSVAKGAAKLTLIKNE